MNTDVLNVIRTLIALFLLVIIVFYIVSDSVADVPILNDVSEFIASTIDSSVAYVLDAVLDRVRDEAKEVLHETVEDVFDKAEQNVQEQIDSI
ncbi:MAG: hypothetical protein F4X82_02820 [Candidatus Spechtbacteria bacterium SB0662_bin_43]|uniref:Uncharacterized protein n=1 Tax=Candidatus Spechtbacteria bacterium SB0662_bin_43 TaxID=2604897 RepID=A0A845DM59_9BACT|nr:hypothetical protein [Candidatus Spechtbacteria bacterium SB0662_bin_43]